jgi:C_GCAxxG_C_C family probable redox protein
MSDELAKKALEFFSQDYNCAQSVLRAILEHKGKMFDYAQQISAGFGGGIAHQGETCGAVSGAIMALGILEGENTSDTKGHKNKTYELSEKFLAKFCKIHGTTRCRDLTGIDMTDADARNEAIRSGNFAELCPKFVDNAVRIVLDIFPD